MEMYLQMPTIAGKQSVYSHLKINGYNWENLVTVLETSLEKNKNIWRKNNWLYLLS